MGIYVNPVSGQSKEEFLRVHGEPITFESLVDNPVDYKNQFPVVLINNGIFNAAAVITDGLGLTDFFNPSDHHPKTIFIVGRNQLLSEGIGVKVELEQFVEYLNKVDSQPE